jgi:hypothetical protein
MSVDLPKLLGETVWAAWGRQLGRHSEALELGAALAEGVNDAGYRLAKQEAVFVDVDGCIEGVDLSTDLGQLVHDGLWRDLP